MKINPSFPEKIYSKFFLYITFAIVFCIFVLSSILYVNFENIALSLIQSSLKDSLGQLSYSTTYMTDSIKTLATQIYFEPEISKLHSFTSHDLINENTALKKLRSYKSTTPFIHSIYIYNGKNKTIYKNFGTRSEKIESFFDKGAVNIINNYEKYEKLLPIPRKVGEDIPLSDASAVSDVYTYIFYNVPQKNTELDSALIINVTVQWIKKIMNSLDKDSANNTLIIDNKGLLVNDSLNVDMLTDLSNKNYIKRILNSGTPSGYFVENIEGVKCLIVYVSSDSIGWKFIRTIPYNNIMKKVHRMKFTTIVIGFVILACGTILSFFISRKLYKPYSIMGIRLKKLESEMQSNKSTLKQEFLRNILHHRSEYSPEIILQKFSHFDINLSINKQFILVLLKIDNFLDFCNKHSVNDREIIKFGIMNISIELTSKHFECDSVDMLEDHIVVIMNVSKYCDEDFELKINNLVNDIQRNVEKHLHISLSSAISSTTDSANNLHELYSELLQTRNYFIYKGQHCIVRYNDIKKLTSSGYVYPTQSENKFANALVLGRLNEAKKLYHNVMFETLGYSYNHFHTTLTRLALAVNTLIDSLNQNSNLQMEFNFNSFISEITKLETIESVDNCFYDLFEQIIHKIEEKKDKKHDDLLNKIMDLINKNYMDQNLSIDIIADKVNMSPIYLGRLFKKLASKSISEVIMETRMNKSKELLKTTNWSVSIIAEKSGFSSAAYFYPLFKKIIGTTPSDYRNNATT